MRKKDMEMDILTYSRCRAKKFPMVSGMVPERPHSSNELRQVRVRLEIRKERKADREEKRTFRGHFQRDRR